jgi:uncharacterized phage-associated protein
MLHRPIAIANEFVRQYGAANSLDHLKLQKLVYFTQGWWLAFKGEELLFDRPQVWRYGPVFQSLYNALAGRGREPIREPSGNNPFGVGEAATLEGPAFEAERELVQWVWNEYGNLSGTQLSDITHAPGTPWREIAEKNKFRVPLNTEIPEDLDWKYFAKLAEERGFKPKPLAA